MFSWHYVPHFAKIYFDFWSYDIYIMIYYVFPVFETNMFLI